MTSASSVPSALDPVLRAAPHRIGAVSLVVHDLERLSAFYRDSLGLHIVDEQPGVMRLGTGRTTLLELHHRPDAPARSPQEAGLFHTAFLLPERADLGAWLAFAGAQGITLQGAADHLVSEAVYIADPEGNGIEIYVDRPPQAWPIVDGPQGRQIEMANQRLDFPGLSRLAQSRSWTGFPPGGVIGHVHLQVGELDAAQDFYGRLLGFDLTCRYPGAVFFGSGGYHHQLGTNIWNSRGASRRSPSSTGLADVELLVEPAVLAEIRARLVLDAIETEGGLTVRDPWGTAITLTPA